MTTFALTEMLFSVAVNKQCIELGWLGGWMEHVVSPVRGQPVAVQAPPPPWAGPPLCARTAAASAQQGLTSLVAASPSLHSKPNTQCQHILHQFLSFFQKTPHNKIDGVCIFQDIRNNRILFHASYIFC